MHAELADGSVLGFDVGARRIGVAVGNALTGARALAVVDVHQGRIDWDKIDTLLQQWQPVACVVGDPLTLDGGNQPARKRAQQFAQKLGLRKPIPVYLVDERRTSIEAAQRFSQARAQGTRRRKDAALLDAQAAAIIIERFLSEP